MSQILCCNVKIGIYKNLNISAKKVTPHLSLFLCVKYIKCCKRAKLISDWTQIDQTLIVLRFFEFNSLTVWGIWSKYYLKVFVIVRKPSHSLKTLSSQFFIPKNFNFLSITVRILGYYLISKKVLPHKNPIIFDVLFKFNLHENYKAIDRLKNYVFIPGWSAHRSARESNTSHHSVHGGEWQGTRGAIPTGCAIHSHIRSLPNALLPNLAVRYASRHVFKQFESVPQL